MIILILQKKLLQYRPTSNWHIGYSWEKKLVSLNVELHRYNENDNGYFFSLKMNCLQPC